MVSKGRAIFTFVFFTLFAALFILFAILTSKNISFFNEKHFEKVSAKVIPLQIIKSEEYYLDEKGETQVLPPEVVYTAKGKSRLVKFKFKGVWKQDSLDYLFVKDYEIGTEFNVYYRDYSINGQRFKRDWPLWVHIYLPGFISFIGLFGVLFVYFRRKLEMIAFAQLLSGQTIDKINTRLNN